MTLFLHISLDYSISEHEEFHTNFYSAYDKHVLFKEFGFSAGKAIIMGLPNSSYDLQQVE